MRAIVCALTLTLISTSAAAEGYYGANISVVGLARLIIAATGGSVPASQSNALGVLAGYRLDQYLAGELGVAYYDGTNGPNRFVSLVWTADVVATLPIVQDYAAYAKAGVANAAPGMYGLTLNAYGQNVFGKTYGVGLLYQLYPDEQLRIGAEHVPVGQFANGTQTDISYQIAVLRQF